MVLENEKCCIEIKIDETYTLDSTDNRHYDVTLNPCNYKKSDTSKTVSIHINLFEREFFIALIGPFDSYDSNCAVLEDEILTVLQDNTITQIRITDGTIIRHIDLDCFGCNFAIYKIENGYVLHGEIEITMLDHNFIKKWTFSGKDIFVSVSNKHSFEISDRSICLYDFEDNYYEIDFNGNLLRQIPFYRTTNAYFH